MRWIDATWVLGLGGAARLSQAVLAFAVTPANTLLLAVGAEPLSVTITDPADRAGSAAFAPSDLGTGPVDLVAPALDVSPAVGTEVSAVPAIWAYDGTEAEPVRTFQWRLDGVDIPGATEVGYTPTAPQVGSGLSVVETATSGSGARSVASAEMAVAA